MDAVFADDSKQDKTTRPGMGKLVAVGGMHIPSAEVRSLESELDLLCELFDFPAGEEFKWSPDKRMWMHKNLIEERRTEFFAKALNAAERHGATAIVTIADPGARPGPLSARSPTSSCGRRGGRSRGCSRRAACRIRREAGRRRVAGRHKSAPQA
jgi:hypothetical protein